MSRDPDGNGALNIEVVRATISRLARAASIEINVAELKEVKRSSAYLPAGTKVHITHVPKQTFEETQSACQVLREAGFEPVPHIPVRAIGGEEIIDRFLGSIVTSACVREVLLIAGDYSESCGPYPCVMEVLRSGLLLRHGLRRVSFAGHPEGHPKVDLESIRRAEREKAALASQQGLDATLITQFFFEPEPFLKWEKDLRSRGVRARIVAGLTGPAAVASLLKYAVRCGVGPSLRALRDGSGSIMKLVQDHGPERIIYALAEAHTIGDSAFDGFHFFCFGGFRRTCEWLHRIAIADLGSLGAAVSIPNGTEVR